MKIEKLLISSIITSVLLAPLFAFSATSQKNPSKENYTNVITNPDLKIASLNKFGLPTSLSSKKSSIESENIRQLSIDKTASKEIINYSNINLQQNINKTSPNRSSLRTLHGDNLPTVEKVLDENLLPNQRAQLNR